MTKNNVEAAKEVVRQLRLRDIGGIIVIDFVDMANPKNRATVEEALKRELERDRTKTYVVEISPLGLVEMTRQNVTEGPREILTKRCPECEGDGFVISEASSVVDTERRLRALASQSPRTKAFEVELNARVRDLLVGPGAARSSRRSRTCRSGGSSSRARPTRLSITSHVKDKGPIERLAPKAAVEEGQELDVKLVEVGLYDADAGVGEARRHRRRGRGRGEARRQEGARADRARARRHGLRDARRRRGRCRPSRSRRREWPRSRRVRRARAGARLKARRKPSRHERAEARGRRQRRTTDGDRREWRLPPTARR